MTCSLQSLGVSVDSQVIRNVASHPGVLEQMCELLDSEGVTILFLDFGRSHISKLVKENKKIIVLHYLVFILDYVVI